MFDKLISKISPLYMNKLDSYSGDYYFFNHIRHVNSWYGFSIKLYYRYIAEICMAKVADIEKGDFVLDIGCGIGILVNEFNNLGYNAVGIDVYKPAIKNSLQPDSCKFVTKSSKLPFQTKTFDLIVSREVLEHIPEDEIDACIREWDRVGKGKMVHIIAVKERGESATTDPTHVNVQTEGWWVNKFKKFGYSVQLRPSKLFFSPFGTRGYMFINK